MRQRALTHGSNGIRSVDPAYDLGQLADLLEQAFGEELSRNGEQVLRELRVLSALGPLNTLFTGTGSEAGGMFTGFVWEHDGRLVGNVTVNRPTRHPTRWQVSNVAVLEGYRGRGIGRQLVDAAIDLILRRGGRTAYLFVRDDNESALRLYRQVGFHEVDRVTDLERGPRSAFVHTDRLRVLQPLRPGDGEALYALASQAAGSGQRWLSKVRRSDYVRPSGDPIFQWLGSLFTAQMDSRWGIWSEDRLDAGVTLSATRLWNRRPHQLKLWVHPERRGYIEDALSQDVMALLSRVPSRPTGIALPVCEERAIEAMVLRGFRETRTLILMKCDL
jgi:ribosomal protein S18 acetylase RimI-like enzyme